MSPNGDGVTAAWIRVRAEIDMAAGVFYARAARPFVDWPEAGTPLTSLGDRGQHPGLRPFPGGSPRGTSKSWSLAPPRRAASRGRASPLSRCVRVPDVRTCVRDLARLGLRPLPPRSRHGQRDDRARRRISARMDHGPVAASGPWSMLERRGGHRSDRRFPIRADPVVGEITPGVTRRGRGRQVRVSHSGCSQSSAQKEAGTEQISLEDPGLES
jgi:hypothetical protein